MISPFGVEHAYSTRPDPVAKALTAGPMKLGSGLVRSRVGAKLGDVNQALGIEGNRASPTIRNHLYRKQGTLSRAKQRADALDNRQKLKGNPYFKRIGAPQQKLP